MIDAVLLCANESEECCDVHIRQVGRDLYWNEHILHVHFERNDVMLLSSVTVNDTMVTGAKLFEFCLPPPLNCYVYPSHLIAAKCANGRVVSMSYAQFKMDCTRFKTGVSEQKNSVAVYDVPLDEGTYEDDISDPEDDEPFHNVSECSGNSDVDTDDDEWGCDEFEGMGVGGRSESVVI